MLHFLSDQKLTYEIETKVSEARKANRSGNIVKKNFIDCYIDLMLFIDSYVTTRPKMHKMYNLAC